MQPDGEIRIDAKIDIKNLDSKLFIDPKLNWIASGEGGADKMTVVETGPGLERICEFGRLTFNIDHEERPGPG